jgi:parallel beta-helix repeat protein
MKRQVFIFAFLLFAVPCYAEEIICFNMDTNPGWTTEGQWAFGFPQGGGGPQSYDPTSGHTGSNVYGYNLAGNYGNSIPEYKLTTSAIDCNLAENVTLGFWRWLGVESSLYDHAKVQVSNNGLTWTDVWSNGTGNLADSSWIYCEYDVSAVADRQETVYIRWCMGTTDISNVYAGWNIDDVCLEGDMVDALFISPEEDYFSSGPEGGPFSPACKSYTLTNEGSSDVNWVAEANEPWLKIAPSSGTLAPDSNIVVDVCISADANTLAEGVYTDTVSFTNTNTGFSHTIDVTLCVGVDIVVPLHYSTIQSAINASSNGDTILVLDGTYNEGNIDFNGKAITLRSLNGLESSVIRYGSSNRGFYFHSGETTESVVDGFTIMGSYSGATYQASIYCDSSSPTISNCMLIDNDRRGFWCVSNSNPVITNCTVENSNPYGMVNSDSSPTMINCTIRDNFNLGMSNSNSNPTLINCTFSNNGRGYDGPAMVNNNSSPTLTNCTFIENKAGGMYNINSNPTLFNCIFSGNYVFGGNGGGIYCEFSNPTLTNCTFAGNEADKICNEYGCYDGYGGGIYNDDGKPVITNCIFWSNVDGWHTGESAQIYSSGVGGPIINYSCVQGWTGGFGGTGNFGDDPCFVTGPLGNYYLSQIAAGDANDSPCVNTGSDTAINLGLNMFTTRTDEIGDADMVDMGYHYPLTACIADIDGDGDVDFVDYAILASQWQQEPGEPSADIAPPPAGDGFVDINDLALLVEYWLWGK